MKVSILDYESDLVPDMMDPSICQLFEIEYCANSGTIEGVHAISTTENGQIKEWSFELLPAADQAKVRAKIQAAIKERSLENCRSNELAD